MEIGAVSEAVEVTTRASALESESTRVSTNLTQKLVEDLPLVVSGQIRNVFNLALIAPETKTGANGQFRIGGGQTASWEMTMDGVSLTSASTNYQYERATISSAPVDAIQEFAVESTGMKAEYGRSMGTVSFTTKSGTNQGARQRFRVSPQQRYRRARLLRSKRAGIEAARFRLHLRRSGLHPQGIQRTKQIVLLRVVRRISQPRGNTPSYSTIPFTAMYNGDFSGWVNSRGANHPDLRSGVHHARFGRQDVHSGTAFAGNQIPRCTIQHRGEELHRAPASIHGFPMSAGSGPC